MFHLNKDLKFKFVLAFVVFSVFAFFMKNYLSTVEKEISPKTMVKKEKPVARKKIDEFEKQEPRNKMEKKEFPAVANTVPSVTSKEGVVREAQVSIDFLFKNEGQLRLANQIRIPLFDNASFVAKKISEKKTDEHLYVWKGTGKNNMAHADVVAVTNTKTGYVSLSFNRDGVNYTIQPNKDGKYILRQMRPGNPDER